MPETAKMLIVLTLISGVAGLGLSSVNDITTPLIAENERQFTLGSINSVMPNTPSPDPCKEFEPIFDNSPDKDAFCVGTSKVYRGKKDGKIVGIAVESIGEKAYSGTITALVGIHMESGMLTGLEILKHAETPGLGSLIAECAFQQQLVGNGPNDIKWSVVKDGGDVNQLSGATISSRSTLNAIFKAQQIWKNNKEQINTQAALSDGESCNGK